MPNRLTKRLTINTTVFCAWKQIDGDLPGLNAADAGAAVGVCGSGR